MTELLVQVRGLVKDFALPTGWFSQAPKYLRAVDRVSFDVGRGQVFGLVGESGCGKTTLGRMLLRLIEPTGGEILFDGKELLQVNGDALRALRAEMQIVFQNPLSSLSPRCKILDSVAEPLRTHRAVTAGNVRGRVLELLQQVGLGEQHLDRFPHELSGGQCQRVAIARALALNPRLLVLDEPTSALDVSVQAQIINLLDDLRRTHGLTYILISHDLSVVQHISDYIGVMYLGQLVEQGPSEAIFDTSLHPYTQALLSAIPEPEIHRARTRIVLQGNVPSPTNPPSGCRFHTRCPLVQQICRETQPMLRPIGPNRQVACHLIENQL